MCVYDKLQCRNCVWFLLELVQEPHDRHTVVNAWRLLQSWAHYYYHDIFPFVILLIIFLAFENDMAAFGVWYMCNDIRKKYCLHSHHYWFFSILCSWSFGKNLTFELYSGSLLLRRSGAVHWWGISCLRFCLPLESINSLLSQTPFVHSSSTSKTMLCWVLTTTASRFHGFWLNLTDSLGPCCSKLQWMSF